MADEFVTVPIVVDETTMADTAVARLQSEWPDFEPNEGDLEVVLIEAIAPMAEDAAVTAAQVPAAVFETIASLLHGIVRGPGLPARGLVEFTSSGSGVTIPAGSAVDIDGWAFTTDNDAFANPVVSNIGITAVVPSSLANDLPGSNVSLITPIAPIVTVDLTTAPSGGSDEESLEDFRDRAVREMQLQGFTLVTTRDYELMCLSQPYVGRVLVIQDTVNKEVEVYPLSPTGTLLTGVTGPPPTLQKLELATVLENYRVTNWNLIIADPEITQVNVTYEVVLYPGYVEADVIARVNEALTNFLDPATWGQPIDFGEPISSTWLAEKVVRKNKIIDIIGSVSGVNYVTTVTLADGGTGSGTVGGNGDYTMNGNAPLADANVLTGTTP